MFLLGMKTDANGRKNSSPIFVSIFLAETGSGLGKIELKTAGDIWKYGNRQIRTESLELKIDGDIRKYGNRQIRTESRKNKLE